MVVLVVVTVCFCTLNWTGMVLLLWLKTDDPSALMGCKMTPLATPLVQAAPVRNTTLIVTVFVTGEL